MIELLFVRRHLNTDLDDVRLGELVAAAESAVKAYTHNPFSDGLPIDVQMGIVQMVSWSLQMADKQGIASETLSRHTVTYAVTDGNSVMGYPVGLMSFCKPYRRCRT